MVTSLVSLGLWLILPFLIQSLRSLALGVLDRTISLVAARSSESTLFLLETSLARECSLDTLVLTRSTNALQTR